MHVSCIQAGTLLARLGRPEVSNCIAGLEQYSYSYEEAGEQAREMRRLFDSVRAGERELHHMEAVTPRLDGPPHGEAAHDEELERQQHQQYDAPLNSSGGHSTRGNVGDQSSEDYQ